MSIVVLKVKVLTLPYIVLIDKQFDLQLYWITTFLLKFVSYLRDVNVFFGIMSHSNYLGVFFSCFESQFQRFPYFTNWISHFKGNHFGVTLADFDQFEA